eukprot:1155518-Pelagomonas_calceolata.AAC.5
MEEHVMQLALPPTCTMRASPAIHGRTCHAARPATTMHHACLPPLAWKDMSCSSPCHCQARGRAVPPHAPKHRLKCLTSAVFECNVVPGPAQTHPDLSLRGR